MRTKPYYSCNRITTPPIPVHRGVRQGCPISMTLFCLAIDWILRRFESRISNIRLGDIEIPILAYADDLVLFGSSDTDISEKLAEIGDITSRIHLRFKPAKCGYFASANRTSLQIYGEPIPLVDEHNIYTYLGVPFGSKETPDFPDPEPEYQGPGRY